MKIENETKTKKIQGSGIRVWWMHVFGFFFFYSHSSCAHANGALPFIHASGRHRLCSARRTQTHRSCMRTHISHLLTCITHSFQMNLRHDCITIGCRKHQTNVKIHQWWEYNAALEHTVSNTYTHTIFTSNKWNRPRFNQWTRENLSFTIDVIHLIDICLSNVEIISIDDGRVA